MIFKLHPALAKKEHICDLNLCTVLLEDNADYPWIFLVPKINNVHNMLSLSTEQRIILMQEIEWAEKTMNDLFTPDQLNVAMIGNITPQLHVHIIARKIGDKSWPNTVWGNAATPYEYKEKQQLIQNIKNKLKG